MTVFYKTTTRILFTLILCLFMVTVIMQYGATAATGDDYDPECDPQSSEYVGEEDAQEWCEDSEAELPEESELEPEPEAIEEEDLVTTAPVATTPDCTNMKDCNIPETGPSEVMVSLLGVMVLGYGARRWIGSRHAKHAAMHNLYKSENNV